VLALSFGIGIGMIMAMIFRRSEAARQGDARAFAGDGRVPARTLLFLGTLVALLIAGTLKVDLLTATLWQHSMAWPEAASAQACSTAGCRPTRPPAPKASACKAWR
jgi:hypothetical protein